MKENAKANGIQRGEQTHHQDQSILLVNLRIRNTINTIPEIPSPLDLLFDAILFIWFRNKNV